MNLKIFDKKFREHSYGMRTGFTMIELSLVIAIIAMVGLISAPVYNLFSVKNDLDLAIYNSVHSLRRAQVLSQSGEGDSSWGVRIDNGSIIIFKGSSFISRDSSFDEVFNMPLNIIISGIQEIVYSKLYGDPNVGFSATITFTSFENSRNITINSKGMLEY